MVVCERLVTSDKRLVLGIKFIPPPPPEDGVDGNGNPGPVSVRMQTN
jgi:hypothetical protein